MDAYISSEGSFLYIDQRAKRVSLYFFEACGTCLPPIFTYSKTLDRLPIGLELYQFYYMYQAE